MRELDLSRPVQTREGKSARVLASDLVGTPYCVVGVVTVALGKEVSYTWTKEGFLDTARDDYICPDDLINVSEELILYVGVYRDSNGSLRCSGASPSIDDFIGNDSILGVSKVVLREGHFDK